MEWYQGGIAEGVTLSRTSGSIFVVFIEGNDTQSREMIDVLNTAAISTILRQPNFVAIRIEGDSVTHQQFAQIYKESTAPSIYFIGKNGIPLDIIREPMDENQLVNKINEIVVKNGGLPIESHTNNSDISGEATPGKEESKPEDGAASSTPSMSLDDKLKLAQDLIAKKRLAKEDEEKEKERNKEMERRKLGQDVQKMKRWQHEQELKQMMEERQKAKREDQEARDRVRRQIEEDKREKAARMNITAPQVQQQPEAAKVSVRPINTNTARLQLRMANGLSVTRDFLSSARLQEVIDFLCREHNQSNFTLSTTFPKREFNEQDASQSLVDLQLVPNSVILVIPGTRGTISNTGMSSGGFLSMFRLVFAPIFGLFDYVRSFFFASPSTRSSTETSPNSDQQRSNEDDTIASGKKRSESENKIRRRGNIHQLHEQDSDDENNTWNGNSTQQM